MNCEFSAPNLPELTTVLTNLLSNSKCNCHFINPSKTRILLWKARSLDSELSSKQTKDDQTIYHLRIGIQKFSSQSCLDRNGETYWKFDLPEKRAEQETELPTPELDPITKFQQRQAQAKDYAKQSVNDSAVS